MFIFNAFFAYYFGATVKTDIYLFALSIATIATTYCASCSSSVIIPEAMRFRESHGKQKEVAFLNTFIYTYSFILLIIVIAICVSPTAIYSVISSFATPSLYQNQILLIASAPLILLMPLNRLLIDIIASNRKFFLSSFSIFFNALSTLLLLILLSPSQGLVAAPLAFLGANLLQLAVLTLIMKNLLHWRFISVPDKPSPRLIKNFSFSLLGHLGSLLTGYTPLYLLSSFSAGIITAMNYGQRIADMFTIMITVQFSSVVAIKINELFAKNDSHSINDAFQRAAANLSFILVPISFIVFIFSEEILFILFARGNFTVEAAKLSAVFLQISVLALPFLAYNALVSRLFMAARLISKSVIYQLITSIIMIMLAFAAIHFWGPMGYPLAHVIFYALNTFAAGIMVRKYFPYICYYKTLLHFSLFVFYNLVFASIFYSIKAFSDFNTIALLCLTLLLWPIALLFVNNVHHFSSDADIFFRQLRSTTALLFHNNTARSKV